MTIPLLLAAFFAAPVPTPVTMERTVFLMGTRARIVTVAPDREQARGAAEAAFGTLRAAEERLSPWTDHSELSAVNRSPVGEVLPISPRLSEDLARAGACVEETGGAFDPALGTLVRVWDLRGDGKIPDESEIRTARRNAGWKYLELRPERIVRHRQVVIEEGGFGKGAALDRALRAAAAAGATGVEIDLGGQIARLGAGSRARPIVVAHPRHRQTPLLEITLAENEVSAA
ncbi:MAG: FAD:protein FMN transferase, partial [Thermoanaerobaculia bacterium]|nr:FAD:protein FMN transferase [Thermoanaerobaculia bacterium]